MKITAVHVDTLELTFEEPFVIASSAMAYGPCDLVRVETDEGITGYGEACPAYEFTGETLWTVQDVVGEYLAPAVIGRDPFDIEGIHHTWDRELYTVGNQAAKAAVELALWDIQGKALGRPVYELIGGRVRPALQEVVAFGWDEPQALADDTRAMMALGIRIFKIKVGDTPELDEQRVAAVREAAGPDARITVDANQGWWDAKTAVRAIKLLERHGIEFAEQPVRMDDLEAARFVRAHVDVPIALDESVRGPREALACARAEACDMFVVKLMKTGGIWNALKVNAIAEAAGIGLMIGNMGESSVAMSAHFHLNIALANAVHGDADLPWRPGGLEHDVATGIRQEVVDGVSWIDVPDAPGLGVELVEENIELQRARRRW
ncbi:MAG TPA: dipeptide epimerase [Thermoleophilia bacterium]|nr:dipeptide epimerase [Thermoleophilia bacterium]